MSAASKRTWRKKHVEKFRKYTRESMRRKRGLPEPLRPEPATCECCGRPPNGRGRLHLDHDHITGKFRGWLCYSCNRGIGFLGDSLRGVAGAVEYLLRGVKPE